MLYLMQPEIDDFDLKLDCYHTSPDCKLKRVCNVKVKLDTKFRLPLRNLEIILNDKNAGEFNSECGAGRINGLKLNMKDHEYKIVNSCNGFLCLSDPSNNGPAIVCNLVTSEFVNLPMERTVKDSNTLDIACGFGFSPVTNQYKVIRMFMHLTGDDIAGEDDSGMVAEIHILGTKSWKYLSFFPYSTYNLTFPTYLNGYLYWYYHERQYVMYFDMEKDCFGSFSPALSVDSYLCSTLSIGVLRGELCLTESFGNDRIDFWLMKDYDGKKDWFNMNGHRRWSWGTYLLD